MKKTAILMQAKDAGEAIKDLRKLGVLHVQHQNVPCGKDISAVEEEISLINSTLDALRQAGALETVSVKAKTGYNQETVSNLSGDWKTAAKHIIELSKHYDQLDTYLRNIAGQISQWERWGDFDPQQITELSQKGVQIKLYQVPVKEIASFGADVIVKNIFTAGGIVHCVVIAPGPIECAFKEIPLPKQGLSSLRQREMKDKSAMEQVRKEIFKSACFAQNFLEIKKKLGKEMEFQQVLSGMGSSGEIVYVAGYIPVDTQSRLIAEARNRGWGIVVSEPSADEDTPTLMRNPKWVSVIKPVLGLLGITPGYHELDVSALFLVFFSLFFGILIGDAGYGLVYMLIAFLLQRKLKHNPAAVNTISLLYILSSCAVVWGALTGTFFGQEWLIKLGHKPLIPQLNDVKFMQTFCFFLGALHLSIAHSWRAALKFPSLSALADIGWVCVLWGAFLLARTLILGVVFPLWGKWLILSGVTLVIFFTSPQANILKAVGEGLGTVALSLMNNFTDVVSYVRLFAVGLAGVAIAETTNVMASGLGGGGLAAIAGAIIVIIGHSLNIVLGPMSVLVHGVRLNVLEFSGHASVTWSGQAYEPLKE